MVEPIVKSEQQGELFLPPGFRFHPTDEEIITSYLLQKFLNPSFAPQAIGEVDLNRCEPWDLPSKAKMGEEEWYFFCHKDMKYPTGTRTNRATAVGYWKATGKDREIFKPASASGGGRELMGMKKTLVFYMGRAPRGSKTNWVMHEYRLHGKSRDENASLRFNRKGEWVVSKVFHKKGESNKAAMGAEYSAGTPNVSSVEAAADDDEFINSMMDPMYFNSTSAAVPNMMTSNATSAAYNTDYSNPSTAEATTNPSSFADLPSYSFMNNATNRNVRNYSGSSSWNMFHADDPMESYSLQQQQAIMIKALGGAISQNYAGVDLPTSATAVTGVLQPNSLGALQQTPGAATSSIGQDAKILRDRLTRY